MSPNNKMKTEATLLAAILVATMFLASPIIVGAKKQDVMPNFEYRNIDGSGNNIQNPSYGSAGILLLRRSGVDYSDHISSPSGEDRISPRAISNIVVAQTESMPNHAKVSDFIWQWGQFLDHDMDLTPNAEPKEPFNIMVPEDDKFFVPGSMITFNRSRHNPDNTVDNPRQQINVLTAFIDASNVYGSDPRTAELLRTSGDGKLKTSDGNLLPLNAGLFIAGDVRVNEQFALTAMHTLFMREHNRLADEIATKYPGMSGEQIYQITRKIVGAQMQVITYKEYLPMLLGHNAIPPYKGYDQTVNPGISNEFSTASFRFGHSMLSPNLLLIKNSGDVMMVPLRNAFLNPDLVLVHGIEPILRGLATQRAQELDSKIVDDVRNFLFGPPGSGGFDLASLNIQRGRDHGLPDYNSVRFAYGLAPVRSFAQISSDPSVQSALAAAYSSVNDIDLWVGGIAEDHVPGALVGETVRAVLADQFIRLRDGDRFWYQNDPFFLYHKDLMKEVEKITLADIIKRNTAIDDELKGNVFKCGALKSLSNDLKNFCE